MNERRYLVPLVIEFFFMLALPAAPQAQEGFCVFERVDPHSPFSHCISRTEWLSVARCSEAANLAPRVLRAPENPPSSQMTFLEAAALMDALRLNFGSGPTETDRFHEKCDRSHTVWIDRSASPPKRAFTHIDTGVENAGPEFDFEQTRLCCEDLVSESLYEEPDFKKKFARLFTMRDGQDRVINE